MNQKPILPDFPRLPEKLRKIAGETETQKFEAEVLEWLINSAVGQEEYGGAIIQETQRIVRAPHAVLVAIIQPPTMNDSATPSAVTFRNKIICRSDEKTVYLVDVPQTFDMGVYASIRGTDRFQANFGDYAWTRVISRNERLRFPNGVFGDENYLKKNSIYEIWSPCYLEFQSALSDGFPQNVPTVATLVIAPTSEESFTPKSITIPQVPGARVFTGWVDINSQAARWTPVDLLVGLFRDFEGNQLPEDKQNTLFDQRAYVPPNPL